MRTPTLPWRVALLAIALTAFPAPAEEEGTLPLVDGVPVLARVNGDPVTADDLRWRIGSMHQSMDAAEGMVQRPDTSGLLQREINARLIVQEAYQIGLDEIPEVATTLESGRKDLIRRFVIDERVKDIHEGDPEVVERLYRNAVMELAIRSARFESSEDASAFEAAVRGGDDFADALAPFVESGEALEEESPALKIREMRPEIASVLREMDPGSMTAPIEVQGKFALIEVIDSRVPEDPLARAEAEEAALSLRRQKSLTEYANELRERYVKVNEEVLDSLDFDAPDRDVEVFRRDERVVAKVKGAEPVTVKEVTARLESQLFHGIDKASEGKKVNEKLVAVLDRILLEKAMKLEATRLKLEQRSDFQQALQAQEDSVLFSAFVLRVVNPDIEIEDEEVERFYAEHLDEYTTSAMIRVRGLPFEDREHAEAGLEKLRQGSDLEWMSRHADGLVHVRDEVDGLLEFNGQVLAVAMLPEGVKEALEGVSPGDFRLYAQPDLAFHVLAVQEFYPAKPRAFAEIRDQILQRVFLSKREQAMDRWTRQLREASEIEVYADDEQIRKVLWMAPVED